MLLEKGVNPNIWDFDMNTALHYAFYNSKYFYPTNIILDNSMIIRFLVLHPKINIQFRNKLKQFPY